MHLREQSCMGTVAGSGVNREEGSVFWDDRQLLSLDISWLRHIGWVKYFKLARNGLTSLPRGIGAYLKRVVKLDLKHNDLSHIPHCLLELPKLVELNLSHNSLKEIPDVVEWSPCLTVLDLSHNQLSSMPINVIALAIRVLDLSYNKFQQVPLCICFFTTLHSLNLSENRNILQLPAELGQLSQLSYFKLNGLKDLNDPPKNLLKDPSDCIRYLKSKLRCTKGFFKMKLMIVGQASCGKTTLATKLQGKDCRNESTVGIDVSEWQYKPSLGKNKFRFSIWDIGGHEGYYAICQCLLSERSLYLVLFNLKHKEGIQELELWLNNIAFRAPNSLVIIVGTHLDEFRDDERAEVDQVLQSVGSLAGAYTSKLKIAEIIPVDLTKLENIQTLKNAIYNHAASYSTHRGQIIMGQKIPASYHALDKCLEEIQNQVRLGRCQPIMNAEEFRSMILKMNLPDVHSDEELKTATHFLLGIGALLHYDDRFHNLRKFYIIDPGWLCGMMAKVITKNPFLKSGILHIKDFPFLVRDKCFSWDQYNWYLTLIAHYEIALPLDNKRVLLVPSMLPAIRPKEVDEEYRKVIKKPHYSRFIIFKQTATPPDFWSRLLSRIMHSVQKVTAALDKTVPKANALKPFSALPNIFGNSSPQHPKINSKPDTSTYSSFVSAEQPESFPSEFSSTSDSVQISNCPYIASPSELSTSLLDSYAVEDIKLYYWLKGIFYRDPEMMFQVEFLANSNNFGKEKGDRVLLITSPTNEGKQIVSQLVNIVFALVNEWYPGLNETTENNGIEQRVPCFECVKNGRAKPFEFQVEQCLSVIARKEVIVECGYYRHTYENHKVELTDIVPDLLLQDIDAKFLLKKEDIIYEEDEASLLGKGGYGDVYPGKCHGKAVAIKRYLSCAFTELQSEAKMLQQLYHPCIICLEGVCVYPKMALVLELAPLGALSIPLLKQKVPIHRLTIFRIALEVATALRFLHSHGVMSQHLNADNVLLWTLNPDSLCHCKIIDFSIATNFSFAIEGPKGFTASESLYDHKKDTFSFAMFLYQMIARRHPYPDIPGNKIEASVNKGERPKLLDVDHAHFAYYYLTKLMKTCWRDKATDRPDDDVIMKNLSLSEMQSVMAVTRIKSRFSLHKAIGITPTDFIKAGIPNQLPSELWVCCDGAEGAEVSIYSTHTMAKVNENFIMDNQVISILKCCDHIWIVTHGGDKGSFVNIFSILTKKLVYNFQLKENTALCMSCIHDIIYIGTLQGYCYRFLANIEQVHENSSPLFRCVSANAVDGITCTPQCIWASHTRYISFIDFDNLILEGSIHRERDAYIGQLFPSPDGKIIWGAVFGGFLLSAWDADNKCHLFDVDTSDHMVMISSDIPKKNRIMTAIAPAEDCVWVGMATGHILVFNDKELLTWFHPYTECVHFLTVLPCSGPCEMEKCMVASGGKEYQSMIKGLDNIVAANADHLPNGEGGYLVIFEAFSSKTYRQIQMIEENVPEMFENHRTVSTMIHEGKFVDGTRILKMSRPDLNYSGNSLRVKRILHEHTSNTTSITASGPIKTVFEVKLLSTNQTVRITCPSPPQLNIILSELHVNTSISKENCRLVYFVSEREVRLKTQKEFSKYLAQEQRPQLWLSATSSRVSSQGTSDTAAQPSKSKNTMFSDFHTSPGPKEDLNGKSSTASHESQTKATTDFQGYVQHLKKQLHTAQQRALDAEQRVGEATCREQHTQFLLEEANNGRKIAEERAAEALRKEEVSQHSLEEAYQQYKKAETQLVQTKHLTQETEQRVLIAEQTALEAKQKAERAEKTINDLTSDIGILSECLNNMKRRAVNAEQKLVESRDKLLETQQTAQEAEQCAVFAERRVVEAEGRSQELTAANVRLSEDLNHVERRTQEMMVELATFRVDLENMRKRAELAEQKSHDLETQWVVRREHIHMTDRELGGGGWGYVNVAKFRGIEVAAKSLYEQIRSDYYKRLFIREMNMAARLRHPNLVQFIGATLEGEMIILTELMHSSLRRVLEQGGISREHTVSISVQVCQALNYLHLMQPDPVIHRDISSANVLLNPLPNNGWLAKVTDYGSVNTLQALQTKNPGNPVYAAPEAIDPSLQSTKMDIFSVGVLLIEMCTGQFPSDDEREHLLYSIQDRRFIALIKLCISYDKDTRPTSMELIRELHQV